MTNIFRMDSVEGAIVDFVKDHEELYDYAVIISQAKAGDHQNSLLQLPGI